MLDNLINSDKPLNQLGAKVLTASVEALGVSVDILSGVPLDQLQDQNTLNFVTTTTTESIADFNAKYPAPLPKTYCGQLPANNVMNGVKYYSWAGVSNMTNVLDPSDYILALTAQTHGGTPNDGLVDNCSARIGKVIRDNYRMNHLDTINQVLGLSSLLETNPLTVYRVQANRLKKSGV